MFHPLPLFVGLRYVRTRRQGFFVSFISWISMAGVCLGVAALITIISVMNGFEGELRNRLVSLTAHATVTGPPSGWRIGTPSPSAHARRCRVSRASRRSSTCRRCSVAPGDLKPVLLHGIDPAAEARRVVDRAAPAAGQLADLAPGSRSMIIGRVLAWQIGAEVGDEVTVMVPGRDMLTGGWASHAADVHGRRRLRGRPAGPRRVAGPRVAGRCGRHRGRVERRTPSGLRVRFDDVMPAPARSGGLRRRWAPAIEVKDWSQEHAAYFRAIRIEKTMMSLILMLVVAVAAFNIVAALVMVVNEKRSDIAILRTLGMTQRGVVGVFLTQGLVIGAIGTLLGLVFGVLIAANVSTIVPVLEQLFGFHVMDPSVYYITAIPSELRVGQIVTMPPSRSC